MSDIKEKEIKGNWTVEIEAGSWSGFRGFRELLAYRDLIGMLVYRNIAVAYKQTILGSIWYVAQPLASTLMFTIIFGTVISVPTEGAPPFLFYLIGTTAWGFFASTMSNTADTFITNAPIFSKVYFPRMAIPISVLATNLIRLLPQILMIAIAVAPAIWTGSAKPPRFLLFPFIPVLLLGLALTSIGVGLLFSAMTTRFRDLQILMSFGVQLWMYATPVVYPLSSVPEKWRFLAVLNPAAPLLEALRKIIIDAGEVKLVEIGISFLLGFIVFIIGSLAFFKAERTSMDTI